MVRNRLLDLAYWLALPGNQWKHCEAVGKGSTRFGSMINGESVLCDVRAIATMWRSSTIA